MIKPVLYLFEGGELEETIMGIKKIKAWVDKDYERYLERYEEATKRTSKEIQGDSSKT